MPLRDFLNLVLVPLRDFLNLVPLSLQTRTKLKKSLKGILNCCKLQIVFKSQNKLAKALRFKYRIPKELTSGYRALLESSLWHDSIKFLKVIFHKSPSCPKSIMC